MFQCLPTDIINVIFNDLSIESIFIISSLNQYFYTYLNDNYYWTVRFNNIFLYNENIDVILSKHIAKLNKEIYLLKKIFMGTIKSHTITYINNDGYYISKYNVFDILEKIISVEVNDVQFEFNKCIVGIKKQVAELKKYNLKCIDVHGIVDNYLIFNAYDIKNESPGLYHIKNNIVYEIIYDHLYDHLYDRSHVIYFDAQNNMYFLRNLTLYRYNILNDYIEKMCDFKYHFNEKLLGYCQYKNGYILFKNMLLDKQEREYKVYDVTTGKFIHQFSQKLCDNSVFSLSHKRKLIVIGDTLYYIIIEQKDEKIQYILRCINTINDKKTRSVNLCIQDLMDLQYVKYNHIYVNESDDFITITIEYYLQSNKMNVINYCYSTKFNYLVQGPTIMNERHATMDIIKIKDKYIYHHPHEFKFTIYDVL